MGLFKNLFGSKKPNELEIIEKSIEFLRLGIFSYLYNNKYIAKYGEREATFWAAAVMNTLIMEDATNDDGKQFYCKYKDEILEEAQLVHKDLELSSAASYLYAAQTIYIAVITKDPFSKRAQEIGEQATHLGIYIPNTYDICGSNDMTQVVYRIAEFSKEFLEKHSGKKGQI